MKNAKPSFSLRESRILRRMKSGKVATGIKLNLSDLRNAELAAMCGFDSIWVDLEHIPNDMSFIENAVRAAKIYDCDVVTRVKRGSYSDLVNPLEADSAAIMVPHLMSLEEAKKIVYYTKFHPIGRRPVDGGNTDGKFCLVDENEYMASANRERLVIVQIEDPEPLAELEEICALPGLDMIFFGPADFSQGIGCPNDFSNPKIAETKKLIAETARKHGKFAGTVGGPGNMQDLIDMGYTYISLGADVVALSDYYLNIVSSCGDRDIKG